MRYLSAEEILILHARVLDATYGAHGVRDVHLFVSILEKPKMRAFGKDLYPGIFVKAAAYLEALATYHVFIDGNKRTALLAAARFLFVNGYDFAVSNRETERFVVGVALKKYSIRKIAAWLKGHAKKIK